MPMTHVQQESAASAIEFVGKRLADHLARTISLPKGFVRFSGDEITVAGVETVPAIRVSPRTPLTEYVHAVAKSWAKIEGATETQATAFGRDACAQFWGKSRCHK